MTRRLVLSYLGVTVVVLAMLEIPLAIFYAQRERERVEADVEHDANVLASIYEDALERDQPLATRAADEYRARTGARVVVVDLNGISQVDTDSDIDRDFSTRPEIAAALLGERTSGTRSSETLSTDILYVAVPVASGGTVHGALRVTVDTSDVNSRIHGFWLDLVIIAVIVLVVVVLLGWLLAQSVTRPVRHLNATAARFAQGDFAVDDEPPTGVPELRDLADSLAVMATQLDTLLRDQRRFVSDASHQLRTPLTAIRLRLENLQSRLDGASATELDHSIDEVDRLTSLVTDLLRLARADERLPTEVTDLAALTRERVDTWSAVAETKDLSLEVTGADGPCFVHAVHGAIEQILDNVLDNAVIASPQGALIAIAIDRSDGQCTLTIADHGHGMTDEQKANATRRFWRADTSAAGTGLGLAIADALANSSRGRLQLGDTPGGGLTVAITLESAPAPQSLGPTMRA